LLKMAATRRRSKSLRDSVICRRSSGVDMN
jgi:hypothetical protein